MAMAKAYEDNPGQFVLRQGYRRTLIAVMGRWGRWAAMACAVQRGNALNLNDAESSACVSM